MQYSFEIKQIEDQTGCDQLEDIFWTVILNEIFSKSQYFW